MTAVTTQESGVGNILNLQWGSRDIEQKLPQFALSFGQVNNPSHPDRTEDSVAAFPIANGEGFALVVADGMSSGGVASKHAADMVTEELRKNLRFFQKLPYEHEVDEMLTLSLRSAVDNTHTQLWQPKYQSLVGSLGDELAKKEANTIGSTVCAAVRCLDENEEPAIRIAARGDSSFYAFDIASGQLALVFPDEDSIRAHDDGLIDWVCNYYVGEMEVEKKGLFTYKPEGGNKLLFTVTDGFYLLPLENQQTFVQEAFYEAFTATGGMPAQTGERFMHIFTRSLMNKCAEYMTGLEGPIPGEPAGDDISIAAAYLPAVSDVGETMYTPPIWDRPTQTYEVLPAPITPEKKISRVIGVGQAVLASERHPNYCADRAVAGSFANGIGGFVAVADGIGKGGKYSVEAAQKVIADAQEFFSQLDHVPTVQEGRVMLRQVFMKSAIYIEKIQKNYRTKLRYKTSEGFKQQIDSLGAAASIGITCLDTDGNIVLLCANRGDCQIRIIDVDGLQQEGRDARTVIRTVTKPDARGSSLTRSVRPQWIDKMRGAGEGFSVSRLPEHAMILATSDGWGKVVPKNDQYEVLSDYYTIAHQEGDNPMRAFTDYFTLHAQAIWQQNPLAPRDDISAAAVELQMQTPSSSRRRRREQ